MSYGKKLKLAIDTARITQAEFAQRIGVTPGYVTLLCNGGKDPERGVASGIRQIKRDAAALNIDPWTLSDLPNWGN